jgi:hypothetical protein
MPPVIRALQYIYTTPEINQKIFELLAAKVISEKKQTGRPGMTLWEILVFAVIRLARDADYDELHYMGTTDSLIRGLLGVRKFGDTEFGESKKDYSLQSIKDNVGLIDEETLDQINELVVQAGHQLVKKKDEKLNVKIDSYVLESNVHHPTDANLLFDAARKCLQLASRLASAAAVAGWRKSQYWIKKFKSHCRKVEKLASGGGGKNRPQLLIEATEQYLKSARQLSEKLDQAEADLNRIAEGSEKLSKLFEQLLYFKEQLDRHIDLIARRLLNGEQIPHSEKVFSLFEPYTEWLKKGKARNRVELGLNLAIATDQYRFILTKEVMIKQIDKDLAVPMAKEILERYEVQSMSFDLNFWTKDNYQTLSKLVPDLVLPKKGKLNQQEYQRQHSKSFIALRKQHSAVESAINCLEHHGLNRCPDKGLSHFKTYTGLGVLACNLHKLGHILLEKDRKITKNRPLKKAA